MDYKLFKTWLLDNGYKPKIVSDNISRLKRIQKEIPDCNLDEEFEKDKCNNLLNMLSKNNSLNLKEKYPDINLPIGKHSMGTYRLSIRLFIKFMS